MNRIIEEFPRVRCKNCLFCGLTKDKQDFYCYFDSMALYSYSEDSWCKDWIDEETLDPFLEHVTKKLVSDRWDKGLEEARKRAQTEREKARKKEKEEKDNDEGNITRP